MAVYELTREKWRDFKEENGLSKSSFFKKADVGPSIDDFQNAVLAFRQSGGKKDLEKAFRKAEALQKAFAKFIGLKEAKAELSTTAKAKIQKWIKQLDTVSTNIAVFHNEHKGELAANDAKNMQQDFKDWFNF